MGQFHGAEPGQGSTGAWQWGACESRGRPPELGNRVPCIGAWVEGAPYPIALGVSRPGEGAPSAPVWEESAWSGVPQWGRSPKAFHFHLSFES